jgi:hypothetical protein
MSAALLIKSNASNCEDVGFIVYSTRYVITLLLVIIKILILLKN